MSCFRTCFSYLVSKGKNKEKTKQQQPPKKPYNWQTDQEDRMVLLKSEFIGQGLSIIILMVRCSVDT